MRSTAVSRSSAASAPAGPEATYLGLDICTPTLLYSFRYSTVVRRPKPNTPPEAMVKTSFDLPESLHQDLKITAVRKRRDMKDLVVEALTAYLKKLGRRGS